MPLERENIIDAAKLTRALDLGADATEAQILERIADLKRDAGDSEEERTLIERIAAGEHDQVGDNGDGSLVVTLLYPLKSGSEIITELVLRRPKFKHLRAMDSKEGDIAKAQALLAAVSGRAPKELDEMDQDDMGVCSAVLAFFSRKRPPTGARS